MSDSGIGGKLGWVGAGLLLTSVALAAAAGGQPAQPVRAVQPPNAQGWSDDQRWAFYTTSQGSHMMPLAWFKALRRLDVDAPFGADQLQRYGYLRNDNPKNVEGLAIGFVVDDRTQPSWLGMTCAACHTSEIEYVSGGVTKSLRVDGAPAKADFQQFLTDLTAAARATRDDPARFDAFARTVLGAGYSDTAAANLKSDFGNWIGEFGDFMDHSLPPNPWGPGRLDAFGMIFNRVAALDLQDPGNFASANAPVRYPFLWNAPRQTMTQWNGSVPNGKYILGLGRNTGEVLGVFGEFHPKINVDGGQFIPRFLSYRDNSVDFAGLQSLEEEVVALKPPPWPADAFPLNQTLVQAGAGLFKTNCSGCHALPDPGKPGLWPTPTKPVGTDPMMATNAARMAGTGLSANSGPPLFARLGSSAAASDLLRMSVIRITIDGAASFNPHGENGVWRALILDSSTPLAGGATKATMALTSAIDPSTSIKTSLSALYAQKAPSAAGAAYESRVLYGIWAAAPYLHNGSVPNLWELLTPPAQRKTMSMVVSRQFDPVNVGFATQGALEARTDAQKAWDNTPGNSNQGHDKGTHLSDTDRRAIIEYLKSL